MDLNKFQEQVFFSTIRITVQNQTTMSSSIGTGFLIAVVLGEKQIVLSLISNKHVFTGEKGNVVLNFHKALENQNGPDLGKVHTFIIREEDISNFYYEHPNPEVDLACLNVSYSLQSKIGVKIYHKQIGVNMISDFSEQDLLPGKEVWFVGYPENRFDTVHNLPLLRRGYISSIPKVDFNSKKEFVIDAQVFKGSSGSPVFAELEGKFKLIGVVSETMIKNEKLIIVPTKINLGVEQIIGLGIVIKAPLIKELLELVKENVIKRLSIKMQ